MTDLPLSEPVRLHQVGAGVSRRLEPDAEARAAIARVLDLQAVDAFVCDVTIAPSPGGFRLDGHLSVRAVQTCGLTLEPLPVEIERDFSLRIVEAVESDGDEIVIDPDAEHDPDLAEDGRVDLGQYAVEQLSLALDPFPRKPGAEFVQPEEPAEISPFAVLRQLHPDDKG